MKKIMFNDKYGLTEAVLSGRKTQTRRIVSDKLVDEYNEWYADICGIAMPTCVSCHIETLEEFLLKRTRYQVGEIVAIAQSYSEIGIIPTANVIAADSEHHAFIATKPKGFDNKMFVQADLMPHQIRITGVKAERLQDISDEDCINEGVLHSDEYAMPYGYCDNKCPNGVLFYYSNPREAYAALIDKISGKGTWESNPFVWVYEFERYKKK